MPTANLIIPFWGNPFTSPADRFLKLPLLHFLGVLQFYLKSFSVDLFISSSFFFLLSLLLLPVLLSLRLLYPPIILLAFGGLYLWFRLIWYLWHSSFLSLPIVWIKVDLLLIHLLSSASFKRLFLFIFWEYNISFLLPFPLSKPSHFLSVSTSWLLPPLIVVKGICVHTYIFLYT